MNGAAAPHGAVGLAMLGSALALMVATGLPVYAVLIAVATLFAAAGVAGGAFDLGLFGALTPRLVGLLEQDLLQALPLYALVGALLNRLPLAAQLHRGGQWLLWRSAGAAEMSALTVGALLAPMNGSVGASLHLLARGLAPGLAAAGVPAAEAGATLCVAGTLGVVVPPSLVLLLLGDAMMRAHTEALHAGGAAVRVVNEQDLMRAALVPGALVLAVSIALVAWRARRRQPGIATVIDTGGPPPSRRDALVAAIVALPIAGLLVAVAAGRLYAVEAAATGALLLVAYATTKLDRAAWQQTLRAAMALTGLLFALLVGATAFTLVLRAWGTDRLVADWLTTQAAHPMRLLALALLGLAACSFVLDAFELIFLVVPLVMPPVLQVVPDPAWVAVLALLVLQLGFLLPPFGYAVAMSRLLLRPAPGLRSLSRALLPHLLAQAAIVGLVFACPQLTRWTRPDEPAAAAPKGPAAEEEVERLMREMSAPAR